MFVKGFVGRLFDLEKGSPHRPRCGRQGVRVKSISESGNTEDLVLEKVQILFSIKSTTRDTITVRRVDNGENTGAIKRVSTPTRS